MKEILFIYMIAVNVLAFSLFGQDKRRAQNRKWRVSEKALLGTAALGGALGAFLGMQVFRHKTKHGLFVWGVPFLLIMQLALLGCLYGKGWI